MKRPQHSPTRTLQLRKTAIQKWGINLGVEVSPPFHVTVRHIQPQSPAASSNLKKDDRITKVNGTYTLGLAKEAIYALFGCDVVDVEYTTPILPPSASSSSSKSSSQSNKSNKRKQNASARPPVASAYNHNNNNTHNNQPVDKSINRGASIAPPAPAKPYAVNYNNLPPRPQQQQQQRQHHPPATYQGQGQGRSSSSSTCSTPKHTTQKPPGAVILPAASLSGMSSGRSGGSSSSSVISSSNSSTQSREKVTKSSHAKKAPSVYIPSPSTQDKTKSLHSRPTATATATANRSPASSSASASVPVPTPARPLNQPVPKTTSTPASHEVIDLVSDSSDDEEEKQQPPTRPPVSASAPAPVLPPPPSSSASASSTSTSSSGSSSSSLSDSAASLIARDTAAIHANTLAASGAPITTMPPQARPTAKTVHFSQPATTSSASSSTYGSYRNVIELLDDSDEETEVSPPPNTITNTNTNSGTRITLGSSGTLGTIHSRKSVPIPAPVAATSAHVSAPPPRTASSTPGSSSSYPALVAAAAASIKAATAKAAAATSAAAAAAKGTALPDKPPSLKRRRSSDAKDTPTAVSSGDHFFCGVKVKLEPVGFGCADSLDDVIEVRQSSEEDTKSATSVVSSVALVGAGGAVGGRGGGGEDDDDEISYVGGNMTTMLEMPHARESCSQYPFVKPIPGMFCLPSPANLKFCNFCYCYVCEGKASDCLYWKTHAQANHKNVAWKVERALLRSKLLLKLNPPSRRATFIQNTLKPSITDSDPSFKKVLDDMKAVVMILFEERYANKLQQISVADFVEPIILLINILKKCQNDIRENSPGYRAMLYLSQALLSTKMFTTSFTQPDMAQAIKEDLSSLSNGIAVEFVQVLLNLTTRNANSMVNWVHQCRLENRCDVPVTVGKVKSTLVSGAIFTALKDIRACPAAVLEFCYRQGDRLTAQCFYWLINSNYLDVARVAIDRIPQANMRRELCQQYVEDKSSSSSSSNKNKSSHLLKYCSLLAVIAPKYNFMSSSEDILSFYVSKMLPRKGVVDVRAAALFNTLAEGSAGCGSLLPFVESLQTIKSIVVTEGRGVLSLIHISPANEVSCLFFLLLSFPFFAPSFIIQKMQQLKRILSQVVLKDAGMDCKFLFLYYFQAWGSLHMPHTSPGNRVVLADNIAAITSEIARDIISREHIYLLKMPRDMLRYWGTLTNECNLAEMFTPVLLKSNNVGVYSIDTSHTPPPLKMVTQSSYVPLYLFSHYLKSKYTLSQLNILMPLMWKSFVVAAMDYMLNSNRFKLSNLILFMQLLQVPDMDANLTVMLKEIVVMLQFFEAVLSSSSSPGLTDADDYKVTKLLRRIVSILRKPVDNDSNRWLFWQALLSHILKKVLGENKYDMLNFLIIEDWRTLQANYFSVQGSTVAYTSKFKALLLSKPNDVDVENKSVCIYLWQRLCAVSPQLINALASSSEPTVISTLLYHSMDNIADITPHLKSPAVLRIIHRLVINAHSGIHDADDGGGDGDDDGVSVSLRSKVPEEAVLSLQLKWEKLKTIACEKMELLFRDESLEPSRNDVLLAIVLNLKDTFALLFPRLPSSQDHLIELFRQSMTIEETTFLAENTIVMLRHAILNNDIFRQQLSKVFEQFDFFSTLREVSSSLCMIQVMALLFPSAQTITTFMSQKDHYDDRLVREVFNHFQLLLTRDFEGSNISVADAFQLYVQFSDEESVRSFFFSLYTKKINPLVCENFISYCFSHMASVGFEKCGMILSWLVAFCYRFYQEVNRDVLRSLQEGLLAFSTRVDCSAFHLSSSSQGSTSTSTCGSGSIGDSGESKVNGGSAVSEGGLSVSLSVQDVYYSKLEVSGEDQDLQLMHPKYAFNFLQLIIYPQSERYDALPIHLLSSLEKRITLHFLFDIENPVVFLSTALKSGEFASLKEKIVNIPFTNPHWHKILAVFLVEIRAPPSPPASSASSSVEGEGKGVGDELTSPLKKKRRVGGSFSASDFLFHSVELLVMMQVMLSRDSSSSSSSDGDSSTSNIIKGIFYHLDTQLLQPSERCILKNIVTFKSSDILNLVVAEQDKETEEEREREREEMEMEEGEEKESVRSRLQHSKVYEQIAKLCFCTAAARWSRVQDKISKYIELFKLSLQIRQALVGLGVQQQDPPPVHGTPLYSIFQKVDFRLPLSQMMTSVLSSQVLGLLQSTSERDGLAYVSALQTLISIVRAEDSDVVMSLLPSIAECLESSFLRKAMTSVHVTSGYVSSALWTQLINEVSTHIQDPSCIAFMKFLCHVSTTLHNLTPTNFMTAAASAAENKVLPRWLVVLHDIVIVEDMQHAQAVASLLFSIPKEGEFYSIEFWQKMYDKIAYFSVLTLAESVCTESRCSDASFLTCFFSHTEIVNALSVDLDGAMVLEEPNPGLDVLWSVMVQRDDPRIVSMMRKVVYHMLNERLTQTKKMLFNIFLPKMKSLFYKAGKIEIWRKFCVDSASFCGKKKPLVLILMDASC